MYAICKEVHPPTGVEHSLYCNFFNNIERNLVVVSTNLIRVYNIIQQLETAQKTQERSADKSASKQKLQFRCSFELHGNVTSIESVRLPSSTRDSFLLAYNHAKLSLVEYDPDTHDLKTLSLHYFEEEELKDGHCQQSMNNALVRVDPEGRCACMLIYGSRLVILPFRRDVLADAAADVTDGVCTDRKTPTGASYIIDLKQLDERVVNVIDIQFLHGYYEPTLFILYEPLPTWAGRIAARKDSCSLVAVSLNMQEKVHPTIWSMNGLPFDCFAAHPVPKPLGGVLLFAVNSLMYLNQSFPPYAVSLNSYTDCSTDFPLKKQEGVRIALDCACATFISYDKVVISLKSGELYVLTLILDNMRAVRQFSFNKAAASVLTSCITACDEGKLFLGSRLGNSLLLKYTERLTTTDLPTDNGEQANDGSDEPAAKRQKKDNLSDWMASDISTLDDLDELEVYGKETTKDTESPVTQYTFEVCDSLMNIGPCGQCIMGEPAFLSEEFGNSVDPDLELVTTSGFGKNGAISVLQRTIRPQVVTTFELPGCTDMWTVKGHLLEEDADTSTEKADEDADKAKSTDDKPETLENGHAFLILSRDDNSMILKTGQEIMELDQSGFDTQSPTLYAGNIGDDKYIIQITKLDIRLMEGTRLLQLLPLQQGGGVHSCSVADPYILVVYESGQVVLLSLKVDVSGEARLQLTNPDLEQTSRVVAVSAYKDLSGLFYTSQSTLYDKTASLDAMTSASDADMAPLSGISTEASKVDTVDDEDELLYGDSGDVALTSHDQSDVTQQQHQVPGAGVSGQSTAAAGEQLPTYWAVLATDKGELEIYSLPDFTLVYFVKNFAIAPTLLLNALCTDVENIPRSSPSTVRELLLIGLGYKQSKPFLMARVNEDLVMYEVFPHQNDGAAAARQTHLQLRFKKYSHGLVVKEKRQTRVARSKKAEMDLELQEQKFDRIKWLRPFQDVSQYSGVFICGPYPHWMFMTNKGALHIHPMSIDGYVTCFAPFHNVNCPKGFLYFNKKGEMRICVLPTHVSYDAPWPVRKVPLRCTPHHVAYHVDSKTYSVVTSVSSPNHRIIELIGDGEKEFKTVERGDDFLWPSVEKYTVQLFSPVSWEPIPSTKIELDEFEVITGIKHVNLKSEGTLSGLKGYIAVTASICYSEEIQSKGRIIIYDVIEVVPEPGQPLTKNKIKIEYNKDQKGPVTTLDSVQGFLVTAVGQKIYIWQLRDGDLQGIAFIDTQIYIHQMSVIKNLILVADVARSISLMRYQEEMKVLSLVSRDVKPLQVYGVAYLVDNTSLCFVVSDRLDNLIVYTYQPEIRESFGGQRLLRRADFHLGHKVNTFFRVKCKLSDPSSMTRAVGNIEKRHVTFFATLDGSIGFLQPVTEKTYRRLLMLQNALGNTLPHPAGLNPKSFRQLQQEYRDLSNPQHNILDGQLLWRYLDLSIKDRHELASRIGTTMDQLIENFMEIDRTSAHF